MLLFLSQTTPFIWYRLNTDRLQQFYKWHSKSSIEIPPGSQLESLRRLCVFSKPISESNKMTFYLRKVLRVFTLLERISFKYIFKHTLRYTSFQTWLKYIIFTVPYDLVDILYLVTWVVLRFLANQFLRNQPILPTYNFHLTNQCALRI